MIDQRPVPDDVAATQDDVIAFLADPSTYTPRPETVERIETHGAIVFLAGDQVHKIKKAVRFPYMDFGSLAKRRAACEREIEVNLPQAPQVYRDAVAITRQADGMLAVDGDGVPVEWCVRMNRFDQEEIFDRLADAGRLDAALLRALTDVIRRFHAHASVDTGADGVARIAAVIDEVSEALSSAPDIFGAEAGAQFAEAAHGELDQARHCLKLRARRNRVRRCHGDLHLGNIVRIEGEPVLFDAIEFDEKLATIDVLYDLAFLLMDLCHRQRAAEANLVLNRYLTRAESAIDLYGMAAMPLFLACRAGVRAMVAMNRARQHRDQAAEDEARRYCDHALEMLHRRPAELIAIGGLSGTGKSTLAAALAPQIGVCPGAIHLRSDVERKAMFEVAETERLGEHAYSSHATTRVYELLRQKARIALVAGSSVIVDAVFSAPTERRDIEAVARTVGVRFTGLWLNAGEATLIGRVAARRGDASDATPEVVRAQISRGTGPVAWHAIDAGGTPEETARKAIETVTAGAE